MTKRRSRSRWVLIGAAVLLIAAALAAAFWPRPVLVDLGTVTQGPMMLTIDEEGRTQVSEPYMVSTPVAGRLQRVEVSPGDTVVRGETVVAHMLPTNPAALDIRTREQARAAVTAAEAAVRMTQADLNAAIATRDVAESELVRTRQLAASDLVSEAALDRAEGNYRIAITTVDTAAAAIAMREADLANAQSQLLGFEDPRLADAVGAEAMADIPLYAPADGRILRILQQSETTLPAGTPVMEIGDVANDLEVVVDLMSSDAVRVGLGDAVIIDDWGGEIALSGVVARIDPFAITKVSALGVEEQRVPVTVALTSPAAERLGLGHGYRVEARIVVWEEAGAVQVPASALFREGEGWAVFVDRDGAAATQPVTLGPNNGQTAQILSGLAPGDRVILYPSAAITEGVQIAEREF
ncbi:MAG: HlyD family efflux transporter periplasmic adaptor subunit [Flavimaricola sp.]|nr:HlyD family efflux transporter periplasmic adaptor subunit [Flavimaricola sp.]